MFENTIIKSFAGAHNLRNYKGKCEQLHGHNWKVEVTIKGSSLVPKTGILLDFTELKRMLNLILERLDHKYLNELPPFLKINPSSENISRYIFIELKKLIKSRKIKLYKVKIWESDSSFASYSE